MDQFTDIESMVCANWENNFSSVQKHIKQGYKSAVYLLNDEQGENYLLKAVYEDVWSERDAMTIAAQQILANNDVMPKIHVPKHTQELHVPYHDHHFFLQEMIQGREADFNETEDLARTQSLLNRLHGFDTTLFSLKAENPLEYLQSKHFNDVLHMPEYKNRFAHETVAAIHSAFTSAGQYQEPELNADKLVVVHGDLKSEHVLLGGNSSQDRLVDCDTMHLGLSEEDYARLLTSKNVDAFLKSGAAVDADALAYHQHLFLLGELSSSVKAITTYADRKNMPQSFIEEQNKRIQETVPARLQEIKEIGRKVKLADFRQSNGLSPLDDGTLTFDLLKPRR